MDRNLVAQQEREIRALAQKHGTTVEKVKEIIRQTGARSRKQIEEALDAQFPVHYTPGEKEHAE
jgi:hypothetical protein